MKKAGSFWDAFRVEPGSKVWFPKMDPSDTRGLTRKADARAALKDNIAQLADLQYRLYAEDRRSLLVVLQAMDAGGKDGTIRHVMSGVNPQGCRVTSFKAPSDEELDHDFLWRIHKAMPRRGEIGIFNRSHYEDVVTVRVLDLVPKGVWRRRFAHINAFEKTLAHEGTTILKFFLHVSKDEQRKRLQKRFENPRKMWKANPADLETRERWGEYMDAYEDALSRCSTRWAPWFVIPADVKWFRDLAVSQIMVRALEDMKLRLPPPSFEPGSVEVK
jgi:PPK2 family polyphosphate:nucleotide phosphotransferase